MTKDDVFHVGVFAKEIAICDHSPSGLFYRIFTTRKAACLKRSGIRRPATGTVRLCAQAPTPWSSEKAYGPRSSSTAFHA